MVKINQLSICKSSFEHQSWIHIIHDIEKATLESGNLILSNGGSKNSSAQYNKCFKCSYWYRKKDSRAKTPTDEMPFRKTTINDRRNSQGKDRKTGIKRVEMMYKDAICKFNFKLMWDEYGYFVSLKYNGGNPIHISHPKPHDPFYIPIPTQLLDKGEEETVQQVVDSACNKADGRNYMFYRFWKFARSMNVAYLDCKENNPTVKKMTLIIF